MQFQTFSLPHITGGTHENSRAKLVTLTLSVDVHRSYSAHHDATEAIYADALTGGAGTMSREVFLDILGKTGGSITVSVARSILTISLRAEASQTAVILKLLKAMLEAPTFAATELTRIKKNLHNDLELEKENARGRAHTMLQNALFGVDDRRQTANVTALQKAVASVQKADLEALHTTVREEPWTVTMSGTRAAITSIKKLLISAKGKHAPKVATAAHTPKTLDKRVVLTESIPSKHNVEFSIGGPLPLTIHHPDYLPFVFGLAVLGKWGGFAGRLMSTVREKEGLTYSIYGRTETVFGNESGYWRIMTFFAPDKAMTGVNSTLREIATIAKKGVTDSEVTRFRTILNTQQTLLNDSLLSSLSDLHGYLSEGFTLDQMAEYKARLRNVTKAEVNAALKKYLNPEQLVISAAGPVVNIKKDLETLAT
jgi:zinc protease